MQVRQKPCVGTESIAVSQSLYDLEQKHLDTNTEVMYIVQAVSSNDDFLLGGKLAET